MGSIHREARGQVAHPVLLTECGHGPLHQQLAILMEGCIRSQQLAVICSPYRLYSSGPFPSGIPLVRTRNNSIVHAKS